MNVFEAIMERRSVRQFLPDPVSQEDLERILDAARYAPTAGNVQPWRFLLVREARNRMELKEAVHRFLRGKIAGMELTEEQKTKHQDQFHDFVEAVFGAPVWVLVFVDEGHYPELVGYDGAAAVQNMLLAAHALGYGTAWQTTIFPELFIKGYFAIPDPYRFICGLPIGRPADQPERPPKKTLAECLWEEQFPPTEIASTIEWGEKSCSTW